MDEVLKQRLVGASVWVVLIVVFLPLIFDGAGVEKRAQSTELSLPEDHSTVLILEPESVVASEAETRPASHETDAQAVAPTQRQKTDPPQQSNTPSEPSKPIATPTPQTTSAKTKPEPSTQTVAVKGKAEVDEGWIVQIGSFSSRDNADGLSKQLGRAGYHSFVEAGGSGSSRVHRVRIGPMESRELAEQTRLKLKREEKRDGLVMEYP
ncbi:sporulation and cell division repeat protein [gamma proteobacterium HTCC5015]|nr:sporulation and cell division repeat protein [gamma proteobacterium HTCC5015]